MSSQLRLTPTRTSSRNSTLLPGAGSRPADAQSSHLVLESGLAAGRRHRTGQRDCLLHHRPLLQHACRLDAPLPVRGGQQSTAGVYLVSSSAHQRRVRKHFQRNRVPGKLPVERGNSISCFRFTSVGARRTTFCCEAQSSLQACTWLIRDRAR